MRFEIRELGPGEAALAAAALLELRPHFQAVGTLAERAEAQRAEGYRIVAAFEGGEAEAAAAAGFRIARNLAWGPLPLRRRPLHPRRRPRARPRRAPVGLVG